MWFRQLPFQTLLVFCVGIGLGFAWRTGRLPLELSPPNMGRLSDTDSANTTSLSSLGISDSQPNQVSVGDPAGFADQKEPAELSTAAGPSERFTPPRRPDNRSTIIPAVRPQSDEVEWSRPADRRSGDEGAEAAFDTRRRSARNSTREIRLAANQEPAAGSSDSLPAESPSSPLSESLKTIDEQIANREFLNAHRTLSKMYWNQKETRDAILPRLKVTAQAIFFEPKPDLIEPYIVQPNDQLRVIANKYRLSWEYLSKLNRTEPRRLQLNQKLKVLKGPFGAVVDLNDFALTVHLQGYFVKRYIVGIGKDEASPIGKFPVLNKIENPEYTGPDGKVIAADDPKNPLGERWIDLGDSYGIHGTIDPDSIGKAASRGCIRMRSNDVIEVYDFLVKGSEVLIRK